MSTGCGTILIDRQTLHALTFLGLFKTKTQPELLESLWKHVGYLIIDEVSMIWAHFFIKCPNKLTKSKCGTAHPWASHLGVNGIIMGDIGQLPPVNVTSLFLYELVNKIKMNVAQTPTGQESLNRLHGVFLWWQLNKVVELKKYIRAEHVSED
jgi:hypothetical protein